MTLEYILNLILGVLAGAGVLIPVIDLYLKKGKTKYIAVFALLSSLTLSLMLAYQVKKEGPYINGPLVIDFYGAFLSIIACIGALFVLLASIGDVDEWETCSTFNSLTLIALLGIIILIFTLPKFYENMR